MLFLKINVADDLYRTQEQFIVKNKKKIKKSQSKTRDFKRYINVNVDLSIEKKKCIYILCSQIGLIYDGIHMHEEMSGG